MSWLRVYLLADSGAATCSVLGCLRSTPHIGTIIPTNGVAFLAFDDPRVYEVSFTDVGRWRYAVNLLLVRVMLSIMGVSPPIVIHLHSIWFHALG